MHHANCEFFQYVPLLCHVVNLRHKALSCEEGGQLSLCAARDRMCAPRPDSSLKSKLPIITVTLAMRVSPPRTVALIMTSFTC
jgi:hypothetical protein